MLKISAKLGGLAPFKDQLETLASTPVTLHEAARDGKVDKVREFLDKGEPVDKPDYKEVTALGYAVGHNQAGVVKILLDRGASMVVDSQQNTALHFAAGYGRIQILELLQDRIKDLSPVNAQGKTPLGVAEQNGSTECVKALRAKGGK
jgi:ankyrin repeat protein